MDHTCHVCLTVWQDLINTLKENQGYRLTDITVKHYDAKLSTTCNTNVELVEDHIESLDWNELQLSDYLQHEKSNKNKNEKVLCCPNIVNVALQIYQTCWDELCKS